MKRIEASSEAVALGGIPELWRIALDCLAADESMGGPIDGLRQFLTPWIRERTAPQTAMDLGRHRLLRELVICETLVEDLSRGAAPADLTRPLDHGLIRHAGRRLGARLEAIEKLRQIVIGKDRTKHAMAASLLLAADPTWAPQRRMRDLGHARLIGAKWPRVCLDACNLDGVDFYLVDLRGAKYDAEQREHFRRCGAILG